MVRGGGGSIIPGLSLLYEQSNGYSKLWVAGCCCAAMEGREEKEEKEEKIRKKEIWLDRARQKREVQGRNLKGKAKKRAATKASGATVQTAT